jgi:L-asparaginase
MGFVGTDTVVLNRRFMVVRGGHVGWVLLFSSSFLDWRKPSIPNPMQSMLPVVSTAPVVAIKERSASTPRSVLIINTGGTIGMRPTADGSLACEEGFLCRSLLAMLEFERPEMPATYLLELLPLMDSSDMGPDDWERIARIIETTYWHYEGFVIVMGTDTMAYAASALSFMLEALGKPVIFTGSMMPLCDLVTDARRNLIASVIIAGSLDLPEVCVFMDARLMRGNRTVKSNSEGLDGFVSPNCPPLATLETGIRLKTSLVLPPPQGQVPCAHTPGKKHCRVAHDPRVLR